MFWTRAALIRGLCGLALVALAASGGVKAAAEERSDFPTAYDVQVSDVAAKVGETTLMRATLKIRDGFRILKHYNNRVIELSSFDDGVAFERKVVPATVDGDALIFEVPLHPTKAGKHPINGVFRVGFIQGTDNIYMVSLRLIANVTGAE